jgi:uncharacterized protein (DUF488 family)
MYYVGHRGPTLRCLMRIYTVGYSGKSAEKFFRVLRAAGVRKVVDIRRSNNTLYAGFTRSRDLPYFLEHLCGAVYVHEPEFAPSEELLRGYQAQLKAKRKPAELWPDYVKRYTAEIAARPILERFEEHAAGVENVCFLCMEATAEYCHRRLLAEYIAGRRKKTEIEHL